MHPKDQKDLKGRFIDFRITWKNEPKASGGLYGGVNYIELPESLTGVKARIVCIVGKYFPTGAHNTINGCHKIDSILKLNQSVGG